LKKVQGELIGQVEKQEIRNCFWSDSLGNI